MDYNMIKFLFGSLLVFLFFFTKFKIEDKIKSKKDKKAIDEDKKTIDEYISTEFTPKQAFGYKLPHGWIAVKTEKYLVVADYLTDFNKYFTNWEKGIKFAYEGGCYVCPSDQGWTFVLSPGFFIDSIFENKNLMEKLINMSIEFNEIHCYTSYRTIDQNSWVKILAGKVIRAFSINNSIKYNFGERTEIEKSLIKIKREDFNKGYENIELILPHPVEEMEYFGDEQDVFKIAEDWDVNPLNLEDDKENDNRLGVMIWGKTIFH
jgi:hypothetical protein